MMILIRYRVRRDICCRILQTSSTQSWATGLSLLSVTQRHLLEDFADFFNTELDYRIDTETSVGRIVQTSSTQSWTTGLTHRDICWQDFADFFNTVLGYRFVTAFSHTETSAGGFCRLLQHRSGLQV
jgi:hypothetical protein